MKNKKIWNVLVFPGGTENGLEINRSLRYSKEVELFSISNGVKNHADYMYKNHFVISDINNKGCIDELNKILIENKIDFIFPANSLIIDFLIENRNQLASRIIQPNDAAVKITRSKMKTYELFKGKLAVPKTFKIHEIKTNNLPVFIKPDNMYGSQGVRKIETLDEIKNIDIDLSGFIISEFLPGDEYTVECFSNKYDGVLYCSSRSRERIRMGTTMHSEKAPMAVQKIVEEYANIIFDELKIFGLWFFQVKYSSKKILTLLEIETRVAGTMAFSRALGVNLPLANLYIADGKRVSLEQQKYELIIDRSLANRYKTDIKFNKVYIDLDDTIILKNRINTDIIKFIYQCINKNIKLILISKSIENDKNRLLKKYKLDNLFDEIIWLKEVESKANYISDKQSIFIDDSFSERLEVEKKCEIFTFEPNMIEVLLDEKN